MNKRIIIVLLAFLTIAYSCSQKDQKPQNESDNSLFIIESTLNSKPIKAYDAFLIVSHEEESLCDIDITYSFNYGIDRLDIFSISLNGVSIKHSDDLYIFNSEGLTCYCSFGLDRFTLTDAIVTGTLNGTETISLSINGQANGWPFSLYISKVSISSSGIERIVSPLSIIEWVNYFDVFITNESGMNCGLELSFSDESAKNEVLAPDLVYSERYCTGETGFLEEYLESMTISYENGSSLTIDGDSLLNYTQNDNPGVYVSGNEASWHPTIDNTGTIQRAPFSRLTLSIVPPNDNTLE